jgi:hypothetical protein
MTFFVSYCVKSCFKVLPVYGNKKLKKIFFMKMYRQVIRQLRFRRCTFVKKGHKNKSSGCEDREGRFDVVAIPHC